jgi:hypothetical protein
MLKYKLVFMESIMKYKLNICFLFMLVIGSLILISGCTITNPERKPREFTLENNTGDRIIAVYLKHPNEAIWGTRVNTLNIETGTSRTINVPDEERYDNLFRMDIKVESSNDVFYTKFGRVVTNNSKVTFILSDLDDDSARTLTIQNLTGEAIWTVHAKDPDSPFWGNSLITLQIADASTRAITIPRANMSSEHRADIKLESASSTVYIRNDQRLTHRGTIQFQSGDLDDESARTFTLGNLTGDTITTIHIKSPDSLFWGSNMLPLSLAHGTTRNFTVTRDKMNDEFASDIKLETQQGVIYLKSEEPIQHMHQINFTMADLDADSPRRVTIGNATGHTVTAILVKSPESELWGDNYLSLHIANGTTRTITIERAKMDEHFRSDIRLISVNLTNFTKVEHQILHNSTINFLPGDAD